MKTFVSTTLLQWLSIIYIAGLHFDHSCQSSLSVYTTIMRGNIKKIQCLQLAKSVYCYRYSVCVVFWCEGEFSWSGGNIWFCLPYIKISKIGVLFWEMCNREERLCSLKCTVRKWEKLEPLNTRAESISVLTLIWQGCLMQVG